MKKVDIKERLEQFSDYWAPRVIARLNNYEVKLAKFEGEFVWHSHETTDELFLVLSGHLTIQFRDRSVSLNAGELLVVPKGIEHCPRAEGEVAALLIEPAGVVNTGDNPGSLTARYNDDLLLD